MIHELTYIGAFLAGLLSFASPCVLPLVPPYLGYIAGVSLDQLTGTDDNREADIGLHVFGVSLAFVFGFSTVFVMLGASASLIGQVVTRHIDILGYFAGAVIILMGLHFLGVFRIGLLLREARVNVNRKPTGVPGAYLVGLAFGFGWTPCIGPVLATILAVAGAKETVGQGSLLLAIYSLGIGLPFLCAALFAGPFIRMLQGLRGYMGRIEKAMGVVLVVTGIGFLTGQLANFSYWLLEMFPSLGQLG